MERWAPIVALTRILKKIIDMSKHHHQQGKKPQQQPAEEAQVNTSEWKEVPDGDLQSQEEIIHEFEEETEQPEQEPQADAKDKEDVPQSATFDGLTALNVILQGERVRRQGTVEQWKSVPYYEERDKKHVVQVIYENGDRSHTPIIEHIFEKNWEIVPREEWF